MNSSWNMRWSNKQKDYLVLESALSIGCQSRLLNCGDRFKGIQQWKIVSQNSPVCRSILSASNLFQERRIRIKQDGLSWAKPSQKKIGIHPTICSELVIIAALQVTLSALAWGCRYRNEQRFDHVLPNEFWDPPPVLTQCAWTADNDQYGSILDQ